MSGSAISVVRLPPRPESVGRARRAVSEALAVSGAMHLVEAAELVISELVSNVVVHAGTDVELRITAEPEAIRVEIDDGNPHLPVLRTWSQTAGTGRGLLIVEDFCDRWDASRTRAGKTVWFEIGEPTISVPATKAVRRAVPVIVEVTLLDVPLLMHWAWQEHAASLLRDYLLHALEDDAGVLDDHAAASDALSILGEQLPVPGLPSESAALMAGCVEPGVTADKVMLRVPASSVAHFAILDDLLVRAVRAAMAGLLLSPPTQPEMAEMRRWLCTEVSNQARLGRPTPWRAQTDVWVPSDENAPQEHAYRVLARSPEPLIATNEASVIVAVTARAVSFLGYRDETELLGRRVLVVVPVRFHQAHIAGTTLHVTNGRDVLLHQWITVPVVRADGSEVPVDLHVEPRQLDGGHRVFVASLRLA